MKKLLTFAILTVLFNISSIWSQESIVKPDDSLVTVHIAKVNFTGSALCNDLTLNYFLPDSLKTGYDIDFSVDLNKSNNEADFRFFLRESDTDNYTSQISENISDYFSSILTIN